MGGNITESAEEAIAPTEWRERRGGEMLICRRNHLPKDMTRPRLGITAAKLTKIKNQMSFPHSIDLQVMKINPIRKACSYLALIRSLYR